VQTVLAGEEALPLLLCRDFPRKQRVEAAPAAHGALYQDAGHGADDQGQLFLNDSQDPLVHIARLLSHRLSFAGNKTGMAAILVRTDLADHGIRRQAASGKPGMQV